MTPSEIQKLKQKLSDIDKLIAIHKHQLIFDKKYKNAKYLSKGLQELKDYIFVKDLISEIINQEE